MLKISDHATTIDERYVTFPSAACTPPAMKCKDANLLRCYLHRGLNSI
jgi:hypothetical protein